MSHYLLAWAALCVLFSVGGSQENVAAGVRATQSTTFRLFADANNAIDGNPDPQFRHSSCSSTNKQKDPWWRVDLKEHYRVFVVRVTNRKRKAGRLDGAEIRIGDSLDNNGNNNTLCATIDSFPSGETKSFSCAALNGVHGRFVNIFLRKRCGILTLCEVEVYGALDPH